MFDAHCHLHFEAFEGADVAAQCRSAGLRGLIAADYDSNRRDRLRALAEQRGVWATCGLHPWAIPTDDAGLQAQLDAFDAASADQTWVGVGEFGLDAARVEQVGMVRQSKVARHLLTAAKKLNLPVVLHIVRAEDEMLRLLKEVGVPAGGMCHGFSGTPEQAKAFIKLGLHISIGTSATRGNVGRIREVCRTIPKASMLVETDAPSRPPDGVDGPNHPRYVHRVIEAVAGFLDESADAIAHETELNARRLFALDETTL